MFNNHEILELPQVPRERPILQNLINTARHDRRVRRLKYWAAGNLVAWSIYVLTFWRPVTVVLATAHTIYLPAIIVGGSNQ
jgi:hypothetical protein